MRPQQQNRRMRGRGNNPGGGGNNNNPRRGGPNPLTRNYESNGPDVKIRGSAQQIAEKYGNLARDAQSAGDRVMAENYLQHAEHYNRIIAAAQAQMPVQQMRDQRDDSDDDRDDRDRDDRGERDDMNLPTAETQQQRSFPDRPSQDTGSGPQPVIEGMPVEVQQELARESGGQETRTNGGNGGETDETAPRRPRRPRRGRGRSEMDGDAAAETEAASAEGSGSEDGKDKIPAPAAE